MSRNAGVDENGEYKIFRCEHCPASFSRRQQLLSHASAHKEKNRGLKCTFCLKWFPSNSTLKRHERIHTGTIDITNPLWYECRLIHINCHPISRREAVQMCGLWQIVHPEGNSETAHDDPFRRASQQMSAL